MPKLLDSRRSAHASIRGYLYQALLGAERWMRLGTDGDPTEAILCEGDEDLDRLVRDGIVASEQVKDYSGSLGIGDRVIRETLARFLVTWVELRRQGDERRFVFTTTAPRRAPRRGIDVLRLWETSGHDEEWQEGVREWALTIGDRDQATAALDWLDEHDAWADLRTAVDWKFDAPGLEATRGNVVRQLAERSVHPSLRETLIDRLLSRVLEVSVEPRVEDRVLTPDDLTTLLHSTEADLTAWAATPRAEQLRRTLNEEKTLRPLLETLADPLPEHGPPSKLLTARYEVIPFEDRGREEDIARLIRWCEADNRGSVLLIHGPGGAGKTRLLIEWCRRLRHQGWHAGFLDREILEANLDTLLQGIAPRCLVVDYGETRPGLVTSLLHRVNRLRVGSGPMTRVVLLARTAGAWWRQVQDAAETVEDLVLASPDPIELTPLVPEPEERPDYVTTVAAAYAAARGEPPPLAPSSVDYSHDRYDRILYLQFEALLRVLEGGGSHGSPDNHALARILRHERSAWWRALKEAIGARAVPETLQAAASRGVAALTLAGGADTEMETRSVIETACPGSSTDRYALLVDLVRSLYPAPDGRYAGTMEPDLLAEELVRQVLEKDLDLLHRLLETLPQRQVQHALVLVGRLLEDERMPVDLALRVMERLDSERHLSVPLRDAAAAATRRALTAHLAHGSEPDEAHAAKQARLLNNLGKRLSELGRPDEAVVPTQQAVDIQRRLVDQRRDEFLPDLARSLTDLGVLLSDLGRREDAVERTQQAVDIYRRLTEQRPHGLLPDLATSLNNLGVLLGELGRHEEALEATQEALDIRRRLADQKPDDFLPDLAMSLTSLGGRLRAIGRHEEALDPTRQAVDVYRALADQRPDAFLPDLAGSLHNLGVLLSGLGRREVALQSAQQAVVIRRKLADQNPHAFLPDLAMSLNSLGGRLHALGRREDSLQATQQAVDIYRELADQRPDAFLPDLASSLSNLGVLLNKLGRREDALEASGDAVRTLGAFFLRMPRAYREWMATMIRVYRERCEEAGVSPDRDLLAPLESALAELDD